MIHYQNHRTYIIRMVWQTGRRISKLILRVKGLIQLCHECLTNLNVTCVMQVMLVLHAAIYTNLFKNTETRLHRLEGIFATSILWSQTILRIILVI